MKTYTKISFKNTLIRIMFIAINQLQKINTASRVLYKHHKLLINNFKKNISRNHNKCLIINSMILSVKLKTGKIKIKLNY